LFVDTLAAHVYPAAIAVNNKAAEDITQQELLRAKITRYYIEEGTD